MHRLWLEITSDPRFAGAHHYHVIAVALEEIERELNSGKRSEVLDKLWQELQKKSDDACPPASKSCITNRGSPPPPSSFHTPRIAAPAAADISGNSGSVADRPHRKKIEPLSDRMGRMCWQSTHKPTRDLSSCAASGIGSSISRRIDRKFRLSP